MERTARGDVDWADVRRRIDEASERLRESWRRTPEQSRRILEDRARDLARMSAPDTAPDTVEVLRFAVGGQGYAIESRYAVEVFRLHDLALIPGAEMPVVGVIGWRGRLLTILDLRAMLGASTTALDDLAYVVVLGEERAAFGVLVDSVEEITALAPAMWSVGERGIRVNERYVRGVLPDAALMLDAAALLRVDDDANLEEGTS